VSGVWLLHGDVHVAPPPVHPRRCHRSMSHGSTIGALRTFCFCFHCGRWILLQAEPCGHGHCCGVDSMDCVERLAASACGQGLDHNGCGLSGAHLSTACCTASHAGCLRQQGWSRAGENRRFVAVQDCGWRHCAFASAPLLHSCLHPPSTFGTLKHALCSKFVPS
jgi:hypothetical protein